MLDLPPSARCSGTQRFDISSMLRLSSACSPFHPSVSTEGLSLPDRTGTRYAAPRTRPLDLDRAARPYLAYARGPNGPTRVRTDRPSHQRCPSQHWRACQLHGEREEVADHTAYLRHGHPSGSPSVLVNRPSRFSPLTRGRHSAVTPSNIGLPNTSKSPPAPVRRWDRRPSLCTCCVTAPQCDCCVQVSKHR